MNSSCSLPAKLPYNLLLKKGLCYLADPDERQGSGTVTEDELNVIDTKVEEIRQALKSRRKAEGLTTQALADKTGLSQQKVSYLEHHSGLTGIKDLLKLAAAYGVQLPDLAQVFRASNGQEEPAEKKHCYPLRPPYRDSTLD